MTLTKHHKEYQKRFEQLLNGTAKYGSAYTKQKNTYDTFLATWKDHKLYTFKIFGVNAVYNPVFVISERKIFSTCNCEQGQRDEECWHRKYILSGKTRKLLNEDAAKLMNDMKRNFLVNQPEVKNYVAEMIDSCTSRTFFFATGATVISLILLLPLSMFHRLSDRFF